MALQQMVARAYLRLTDREKLQSAVITASWAAENLTHQNPGPARAELLAVHSPMRNIQCVEQHQEGLATHTLCA
jgi:hypothetical protein